MNEPTRLGGRSVALHFTLVLGALVLCVGAILGAAHIIELREQRIATAERTFQAAGAAVGTRIDAYFRPANLALERLRTNPAMTVETIADRLGHRRSFARMLEGSPTLASAYIGYPDGDFVLFRPLDSSAMRDRFSSPPEAAFLAQVIDRGQGRPPEGRFVFFRDDMTIVEDREQPDYTAYDPRTRPWFQQAWRSAGAIRTDPYIFFTTRDVGVTTAVGDRGAPVLGVDIAFAPLSAFLREVRPLPDMEVALFDGRDRLLAHTNSEKLITADPSWPNGLRYTTLDSLENAGMQAAAAASIEQAGEIVRAESGDEPIRALSSDLKVAGLDYRIIMTVAEDTLMADADRALRSLALFLAITLALALIVAFAAARRIAQPLEALAESVGRAKALDFAPVDLKRTHIREIDALDAGVDGMKETIRNFLDISGAIASARTIGELSDKMLKEIIQLTGTEAAVLYLAATDGLSLWPRAVRLRNGDTPPVAIAPVALARDGGFIARAVLSDHAVDIAADPDDPDFDGLAAVIEKLQSPPGYALAAPLVVQGQDVVGAIVLLERKALDPALVNFTRAICGSAAVSIEARRLIAAQRELFESLLHLIAHAIDSKSPYTGGHCARVPVVTKMIAAAADAETEGPFGDFSLSNDDWDAVHIAAWLHDCGKVTTPEFVVDKATKLETIHDRIHEIRMRVEVMKRDAEIRHLKMALETGGDPAETRAALDAELAALDADFAFIAQCNTGEKPLFDEDIERLKDIARRRRWTRTIDPRQGLSHIELSRTPERPVPAEEHLLEDRPEHMFARPETEKLAPDNRWGFTMPVPEKLYNRGELTNLSIRRGTLTDEDRYKINEHIVETIKMLEALPFPARLRTVPELAGGHHERMDGRGYPRGLRGEQMSPVARMMAVADVFEALTACDRPYKRAKPLSIALKIMAEMARDGHLDPDIFELFVRRGVWRDYARDHLQPEQVDAVDDDALLAIAAGNS